MSNVAYELVKRVLPSSKPENEFEVRAEKKIAGSFAIFKPSELWTNSQKRFFPNLLWVYGFWLRPWFKEKSLFLSRSMRPISETCQKVYHFVVLALSGVRGSGPNRSISTRRICWKKWDLNWDLDEWSKSVVTAKYDLMYRKTIGNISSYLAFQNSHFFNAGQKSRTSQLQFTGSAK